MNKRISFLGLGKMGKGITRNLTLKGKLHHRLLLWNRTHETALEHQRALGESVSQAVSDISAAVSQSDVVWSCLSNETAVQSVYEIALAQDVRGKIFIDSSTITPALTNALCEKVREADGDFIAMPVFGEPTMAETGVLICVPSGNAAPIELIKPLLVGVIARSVIDLSNQPAGQASLLKLVGNTFIMNTMQMVAEGHVFAEKSGLSSEHLHKMVEELFPVGPAKIYSARMKDGGYYAEKSMVHLADAQRLAAQVTQVASDCGTTLPAYGLAVGRLNRAADEEGPQGDISGIYGAVRIENGLSYRHSE